MKLVAFIEKNFSVEYEKSEEQRRNLSGNGSLSGDDE